MGRPLNYALVSLVAGAVAVGHPDMVLQVAAWLATLTASGLFLASLTHSLVEQEARDEPPPSIRWR